MSSVKTWRVSAYRTGDDVLLRVDHGVLTPELAYRINGFWSAGALRLIEEGGDVVRTVIRLFGAGALQHLLKEGGASFGTDNETAGTICTGSTMDWLGEGWPPVGDLGIRIVAASVNAISFSDVDLQEVPT